MADDAKGAREKNKNPPRPKSSQDFESKVCSWEVVVCSWVSGCLYFSLCFLHFVSFVFINSCCKTSLSQKNCKGMIAMILVLTLLNLFLNELLQSVSFLMNGLLQSIFFVNGLLQSSFFQNGLI